MCGNFSLSALILASSSSLLAMATHATPLGLRVHPVLSLRAVARTYGTIGKTYTPRSMTYIRRGWEEVIRYANQRRKEGGQRRQGEETRLKHF